MKKQITKTVEICDVCKKIESFYTCQKCGKAFCFDCRDGRLVEYSQGVYFSGRDGRWCKECDDKLNINPTPVWSAYRAIKRLKDELESFNKRFDAWRKEAEQNLNKLIGA